MALIESIRRHPLLLAVFFGAVMGAVVGVFLPIRAAAFPKAQPESWVLPSAQALKRFREDQFEQVRNGRFWGELAMPGQRAARAAVSNWSLGAIVTRPVVQVSVTATGKGLAWVRLGGALPDGSILVSASRDRIWFEKDGCKRVRSLYQNKVRPDPEGCIGDAASKPGTVPPPVTATTAKPSATQPAEQQP
ncbi:hypothetical protein [Thermomonas carbonis]|uniref:Uncharacterized protein n=1 Tax=Thermomonas carbonis TaxID=1463158 RepID=A0A7G9SU71_9GAMM|nr:hypothetical protein [Thermomonas carbonis]QNN71396.1 hypothetical protein H9L16_07595 [Thermomonas carbonis]GHC09862.1 hypothetical protein GCM10010080_26540 [Thermomonas carbonis]